MTLAQFVPSWMRRFARDERGVISVQNLFLTFGCCAVGAAGMDVTHFYAARTELQVAADVAAHSALYTRHRGASEADARAAAVAAVEYSLPAATYGPVVASNAIVFGTWNDATGRVDPLPAGSTALPEAVQVTTARAGRDAVASLLFRIVGVDEMDVRASAVYIAEGDLCPGMQGVFGEGQVRIRSNNQASPGICFYSSASVDIQNNNDLQFTPTDPAGTACQAETGHAIIAMPNSSSLGDGNGNECIREARRDATLDIDQYYDPLQGATTDVAMLSQVREVMELTPGWSWNGIDTSRIETVTVSGRNGKNPSTDMTGAPSMSNRVHYVNCAGGNLTMSGTFSNTVLLLNNCKVLAKTDLTLSNTIIYNTNTDNKTSFNFGSGNKAAKLVVGTDTDCNGTGAAFLLTRGGFDAPAKMTLNNGTIIAQGDVQFAAQFGGAGGYSRGLSIIAGGTIDATSNGTFVACPPPAGGSTRMASTTFRLAR